MVRRHLRHNLRDRKSGRSCNEYSIPTSGSAAEAQAIRYRPRGAALGANPASPLVFCMCMFVLFCDRRGAWWTRSREAFFFVTLSTSTSKPSTIHLSCRGRVASRGAYCNRCRGRGCVHGRFLKSDALRTCILHFRFVRSSLPTFPPPFPSPLPIPLFSAL